jgi:hypothetical protein
MTHYRHTHFVSLKQRALVFTPRLIGKIKIHAAAAESEIRDLRNFYMGMSPRELCERPQTRSMRVRNKKAERLSPVLCVCFGQVSALILNGK